MSWNSCSVFTFWPTARHLCHWQLVVFYIPSLPQAWAPWRLQVSLKSLSSDVHLCKTRVSRTWDKKIPPEEGFLLFLSGTARACLVPRVPVWYRLSGTPFCSFTSVTMTSQRKAQRFPATSEGSRDVKENIIWHVSL